LSVVVVGGGWAGLAAAVALTRARVPVTVLEASRQLGGRARSVRLADLTVDNGQHLIIGAFHALLDMLALLGIEESRVLQRLPLHWWLKSRHGPDIRLGIPRLPAPLHLLWALSFASGLSWDERLCVLRFASRFYNGTSVPALDATVANWLQRQGQTGHLSQALWRPLCLAALNAPPESASARVFWRVLQDTFGRRRADSDLLIPSTHLDQVFPEPAKGYIERRGGTVRLRSRVQALQTARERIPAEHVLIATEPHACERLLEPYPVLRAMAQRIAALPHAPICTLYLRYPSATRLEKPMVGVLDGHAQWLFDRRCCGQPGLMAAVISGPGEHMRLDHRALIGEVVADLTRLFPHWPAPNRAWVIREKRAAFSCEAQTEALRPSIRTPLAGLWLAGDYTDTGYPATLEGAIRSGLQCAEAILGDAARPPPSFSQSE
jgi:squalene-associated FAD-dependent desaturase